MARVTFYDVSDVDRTQLKALLGDSNELAINYIDESISVDNIDAETEIISVFVSSTVTKEMIAAMPKLKLIACRSTGVNNVDLDATQEHNIQVVNVPTYGENTVAEYAFTLILALARKLSITQNAVRAAQIDMSELTGFDLSGKTLGVIGMGHIGQHMAKIAKGFGMKVLAFDPKHTDSLAEQLGFSYAELEDVVSKSDIVSIHVPYLPTTHHLINADLLSKAKKNMVLINTARGEIVDTKALIDALHNKIIAGAGLDVIEGEKLLNVKEELILLRREQIPADVLEDSMEVHVLKTMPNVIVTPHNAYNTTEAIERINSTTTSNIKEYLQGKTSNSVKPPAAKPGKLLLVRHGESEWNALGKWTGSTDVHLTEKGFREAGMFGRALQDTKFDYAFTSQQIRALETLEGILDASQQFDVEFERSNALNERDYGVYTGKNKWDMKKMLGEDVFNHLRRDWDYHVPEGETLKQVFERAVPFFKQNILPKINKGQTVLVVSHGNAIRALMKYIEKISDEAVSDLEMPFGNIIIYELDQDGYQTKKEIKTIDTVPPKA